MNSVSVIPSRTTMRLAMASGTEEPAAINVRLMTESAMFHVWPTQRHAHTNTQTYMQAYTYHHHRMVNSAADCCHTDDWWELKTFLHHWSLANDSAYSSHHLLQYPSLPLQRISDSFILISIFLIITTIITRHRASTIMYTLTFCVRIMLPESHQWKPAVQAAAVMLRTPSVDGQSPASQPRPLPIYGVQFWECPSPAGHRPTEHADHTECSHYVVISRDGRKLVTRVCVMLP